MRDESLHVLQHALGLDDNGQGTWYRNHFVCGPGHNDYERCEAHVAAGLMVRHEPRPLFGGDYCYVVTDAGKEFVRSRAVAPPKLTRSQRRYREFLARDTGESFGEWIRAGTRRVA